LDQDFTAEKKKTDIITVASTQLSCGSIPFSNNEEMPEIIGSDSDPSVGVEKLQSFNCCGNFAVFPTFLLIPWSSRKVVRGCPMKNDYISNSI
jgi:hypothetical protein